MSQLLVSGGSIGRALVPPYRTLSHDRRALCILWRASALCPWRVALLGIMCSRIVMGRRIGGVAMIGSPLATTTLFTIGPVAVTTPVVVTWGLMVGYRPREFRRNAISGHQAAALAGRARTVRRRDRGSDPRDDASGAAALSCLCSALCSSSFSSRTGPRSFRGSSRRPRISKPMPRSRLIVFCAVFYFGIRARGVIRLSEDFRRAERGDDPAQYRRDLYAHLFAGRAPLRQHYEWRLHRRDRSFARRAHRADPADGARSAHRRGAGLYFHRARHGLHRRRGERSAPRFQTRQSKNGGSTTR